MDGSRFDALARQLAGKVSRRTALRGMVGATLAVGMGAVLDGGDAAATCGRDGVRCNRDAACCSGVCEWSTVTRGRRKVTIGTCVPNCGRIGQSCGRNDDCCNGICSQGTCVTCRPLGDECNVGDCCEGVCYSAVCYILN